MKAWRWVGLWLVMALAWDASGLDGTVSDWFGGPAGFAARDAFWARTLLHEGLRVGYALLFGLALWQAWKPPQPGPSRAEHAWALAAVVLAWLLVPLLKHQSLTSCPWSLAAYGGEAQRVSHWLLGVRDGGPGGCFPAGHAAGGFAFLALLRLWAPWRAAQPWVWRFWCAAVLLGGALASIAQVARGAHFVSHCLWSAVVCAAVAALLVRPQGPGRHLAGLASVKPAS